MIDLELATYSQISKELKKRNHPFILIALTEEGSPFSGIGTNLDIHEASMMLIRVQEYIDYCLGEG